MNKAIFITAVLSICISCQTSETKKTFFDLLGPVKQTTETCFQVKIIEGLTTEGNVIELLGRMYKVDSFSQDQLTVYSRSVAKSGSINQSQYLFDEDGKLIKLLWYDEGKVWSYREFAYDSEGREISNSVIDVPQKLSTLVLTTYDTEGQISERSTYNSNHELIIKKVFSYTNGIGICKSYWIRESELVLSSITRYDDDKYLGGTFYDRDGTISSIHEYSYDSRGLRVSGIKKDSNTGNSITLRMTYEFDNYNNWIKKVDFEDGEALRITRRDIQYY